MGQTGEYLVAAELSRRGLTATPFTGNVPHCDLIASDQGGRHVSVEVKANRGGSWQFGDIRRYCDITFDGKRQLVGKPKPCPVERLVMVFVKIEEDGNDRFYILTWQALRDLLVEGHVAYLGKHAGIRPQRWDSMHSAVTEAALRPYRDRWETITENLR